MTISKYLKFLISRLLGTVVDTLVLWILSRTILDGGYSATYIVAPIISFEMAVMSNFLCSYYWIWTARIHHKTTRAFWRHFFAFNLSAVAGFVVKMLFLLLFERMFGWNVVLCNLAALTISGGLNYLLSERVVFGQPHTRPTHEILSAEELAKWSFLFRGNVGRSVARVLMRICAIDRLNLLYDHIYDTNGPEAATKALRTIGCDFLVGNPERLDHLPEGAFIVVANHPYGGVDGVAMLSLFGAKRSDFKIMVNKILGRVEPMSGNFITVTPTETQKQRADATTLSGIRTSLQHLHQGHPLGIFPSGAVSDLHPKGWRIEDREWQEGLIRLVQRAAVPIVPIHFEGRNSLFYYALGLINWRIRLLRLPREVLNKGRGTHKVVIGETIPPSIISQASVAELSAMLRKAVYEMPSANTYVRASDLSKDGWE